MGNEREREVLGENLPPVPRTMKGHLIVFVQTINGVRRKWSLSIAHLNRMLGIIAACVFLQVPPFLCPFAC